MPPTIQLPTYLDESTVTDRRRTTLVPRTRRADGYGSKMPTSLMLRSGGYWRRVYCVCWSNSGTNYVLVKGAPHYIASNSDLFRED